MSCLPHFLPAILDLNGTWEAILSKLYNIFKKDFVDTKVYFSNLRVIFDTRKLDNSKEEGFWHLITKEDRTLGRLPDYKRAKRLPWAKPTIENHDELEVKVWDYLEGNGRVRIYLWLENYDYAIILERCRGRRKQLVILVTAFYVEEWKRRDLIRRYQNRI